MAETEDPRTPRVSNFSPLSICPVCRYTELEIVLDGDDVNFFCVSCSRCWHVELNRVFRVDPASCGTCAHAQACMASYEADHVTSSLTS